MAPKCANAATKYWSHTDSAFANERNAKHNTMVDLFAKLFQTASIKVIVEPLHMFRDEDKRDNKRPDILTILLKYDQSQQTRKFYTERQTRK